MKKLINFAIVALMVSLVGCYKDLGNYDYKDINEISVAVSPEAQSYDDEFYTYTYVYRQPATEAFEVTYKAEVTQTVNSSDSGVEYQWIVLKNSSKRDTLDTKEITLRFEPKVKTTYTVRLKVTDVKNDISKYRNLSIRTEMPFVKSWLVLHGKEGERRLGAVERPDNRSETEVVNDVYEAIHGAANPFSNVVDMFYTPSDGANFNMPEHLTLLETNKSYYLHPFDMVITPRGYDLMIPIPTANPRLAYGVTNTALGRYAMIVTENGKFFHGGPGGFYHMPYALPEVEDYHVDKAYITSKSQGIIWDNVAKRFMYYNFGYNWYDRYDGSGRPTNVSINSPLSPFPQNLFLANELTNKEVFWMGQSLNTSYEDGMTAIMKDVSTEQFWLYQFNFDTYDDFEIGVEKELLTDLVFNDSSLFAVSAAFSQQFFYTIDDVLYHYNTVTKEITPIYSLDSGESFTVLKFREPGNHYMVGNENHKLAMGVLSANGAKGALHEVTFSMAGDVINSDVFDGGFGPIKNIDFTFIHRVIR